MEIVHNPRSAAAVLRIEGSGLNLTDTSEILSGLPQRADNVSPQFSGDPRVLITAASVECLWSPLRHFGLLEKAGPR